MPERVTAKIGLSGGPLWGVLLAWSCLLLLPFGRFVEVSVLIMALIGLVLMFRNWRDWRGDERFRLFASVFAVSWIPIVLSLPDAVNLAKTAEVTLNHLRFLFAGAFLIHFTRTFQAMKFLTQLIAFIVAFWIIDALIQYWTGVDLLGMRGYSGRVSALFGPGNTKFGLTLAVFVPVLWEYVRLRFGNAALAAVVLVSVSTVLVSGQRSAWITVFAAAGIYVLCLSVWIKELSARAITITAIVAVCYVTTSYFVSDRISRGVDRTLEAIGGDIDPHSSSIVHRYWIWKGAWAMFTDNPINGVGARGFRYAFEDYAASGDPYLNREDPIAPLHSHQLVLELAAETGLTGVLGLLLLAYLLGRAAARAPPPKRVALLPFLACIGGAYFPLNTHLAIYSAYWSQIVWYLLALYCAAAPANSSFTTLLTESDTRAAEK